MEYISAIGPNAINPSMRIASGSESYKLLIRYTQVTNENLAIIFELIPDLSTVPGLAVTIQMLGRRTCVATTRPIAPGRPSNVCYAMSGLPGSAT
jgi:hypothetical protein